MFHSDPVAERSAASLSQPIHRGGSNASLLDPAYLAGEIWRRRALLILAGLLGCVIAAAYAFSLPPRYTAVSQIVIDPRDLNLVQNEVTVTPNGMTTDATLALIESQIAVMTSNNVLGRVVQTAGLMADPEFNGTRETLLSGITTVVSALIGPDADTAPADRQLLTINNLREHITAARNANSFVINLSVFSENGEKAARLANLVTETFIAEQGRAQAEIARRATTALSSRLAELRQRVVEAEGAVEAYKAENRLVGVGGRLIDDEYITRINNQLADVRGQITSLDVRAQSLRNASVNDVAEGSYPEGLNAESLLRLRQTYAEAAQNAAILSTRLGPRHPQRIAADQAVSRARRAIQTELGRIVASAQTELERARRTEADLTQQIDALRSRQIETSGSFVRLRELEREVDASRAVYEAYLLRARQTSEQESLNTANVRVISDATVPFHPSGLSRKLIVLAGGVAGFGFGVFLAGLSALIAGPRRSSTEGWAHEPATPASAGAAFAQRADSPMGSAASPPNPGQARNETPAAVSNWPLRGPSGEIDREGDHAAHDTASATDASPDEADAFADRMGTDGTASETVGRTRDDRDEARAEQEFGENEGDLDRRRAELRDRIRAIGVRRSNGRTVRVEDMPASEAQEEEGGAPSASPLDSTRERISLTLAAAQRRRNHLPVTPSS